MRDSNRLSRWTNPGQGGDALGRQHLRENNLAFGNQMLPDPSLHGALNKTTHIARFVGAESNRFFGMDRTQKFHGSNLRQQEHFLGPTHRYPGSLSHSFN